MKPYDTVRALRPARSAFNLSYDKKFTCELGQLIPIMCDEVVPGDTFKIGIELVIRFLPMLAPILHEINSYVHYFFVPYRLLFDDWESFITGGEDGEDATVLPRWTPAGTPVTNDSGLTLNDNAGYSLWDFLGFPTATIPAGDDAPLDFPRRAYNLIYNEYYRDQTQQAELNITTSSIVKNRCWEKDYFTSALPWQQRGIAPALPISGLSSAVWAADLALDWPAPSASNNAPMTMDSSAQVPGDNNTRQTLQKGEVLQATANANTVDLSSATTFDVADLRLAFQIQKWMERNARGGARYTEFLLNHYGVAPRDERLQRPEYIGGSKMPVIVSEVLQTSGSGIAGSTVQGTMAGHGLTAGRDFCASYKATEFGLIMGILSVMPRAVYSQGINRQWLRLTRYDFYSPEWAHLSEQAIARQEIFSTSVEADNLSVWGYQGRYNEMRSKQSMLASAMRYGSTYNYWHLSRQWATYPALNGTFVTCIPRKEYLAAPAQPALLVNVANIIKAIRPMPAEADPGLIDHS